LRYLQAQGYQSISLYDLVDYLNRGRLLPPKPVVLTFDDGYRDAYTNAFPLLQKYGMTGTFFLVTAPIDQHNPEYLSWEQVKEMNAAGMDMECHTYTHPDLRGKDADYIIWQVVGSKEAIEQRTRRPVRFFAYPSGRYDDLVVQILRSAHFWGAVTTMYGDTHSSEETFALRRVRVHGGYSLDEFVAVLHGQ